jgi:thioredoxin 1
MEELAEKYEGRVTVAKIDVDTEADLASRFGIMGIPTVILFKFGKEVDRLVGVQPTERYEAMLS